MSRDWSQPILTRILFIIEIVSQVRVATLRLGVFATRTAGSRPRLTSSRRCAAGLVGFRAVFSTENFSPVATQRRDWVIGCGYRVQEKLERVF